jgi:hypothetical protein
MNNEGAKNDLHFEFCRICKRFTGWFRVFDKTPFYYDGYLFRHVETGNLKLKPVFSPVELRENIYHIRTKNPP